VEFKAGDSVAFHFHQVTREIFYCLRGPAPFVINGRPTVMREGDCLVCEPGDVHGNPVIENDFRILVLKADLKEHDTVWLDRP
jgi:quercetin dioxygenase-like cupin family protein